MSAVTAEKVEEPKQPKEKKNIENGFSPIEKEKTNKQANKQTKINPTNQKAV